MDRRHLTPPKAFTGRPPFSEFTTPVVTSKLMDGERPARPQGVQGLGLTDSMWDMTVRCWDQDPAQRPTMAGVVRFLRKLLLFPSVEIDLSDFLQVYKTWDKDHQGRKAQEFVDRLDEVRHTYGHNITSSHHTSRFLTIQIFTNEDASIWGTCKSCAVLSAFFHPRSPSHDHSLNAILITSPPAAIQKCTRQPSMTALL